MAGAQDGVIRLDFPAGESVDAVPTQISCFLQALALVPLVVQMSGDSSHAGTGVVDVEVHSEDDERAK